MEIHLNSTQSTKIAVSILSNASSETECIQTSRFYIYSVFASVICFIGLCGNTTSLVVLSRDKQSPVANFLLQTMAVIDNMFLIIWFLHWSMKVAFDFHQVPLHISWYQFRLYTSPLLFATQTATIWITVIIAASRYVAICIPYRATSLVNMQRAKQSVIALLIFSVVYNLPRFFQGRIVQNEAGGWARPIFVPSAMQTNKLYSLIYSDILYYIFTFVLPLLLLSILNTRLTLAYRKIQARRARMNVRSEQDNNITLVMIIVVLVFMLCQAPARLVQMTIGYTGEHSCNSAAFFLTEFSNVLEVLNSSVNFFIYCAFRKQFVFTVAEMMCRRSVTYKAVSQKQSNAPLKNEQVQLSPATNVVREPEQPNGTNEGKVSESNC